MDDRTLFDVNIFADKVRKCSILITAFDKHTIAYVDHTSMIYIGGSKIIAGKIGFSKPSSFGLTVIGKVAVGKVRFLYHRVVGLDTEEYNVKKVAP